MPAPRRQLLPVHDDDFDALADLRIDAMRDSLERIGRFDPQRARERLRTGFVAVRTRQIVCDGERVGFVVVTPGADAWSLDHLYIRPAAQGRGIGGAVLARVIGEAAGQAMRVGALRDSDSNRFYLAHGFVLTERGEHDNHYLRPASAASTDRSAER